MSTNLYPTGMTSRVRFAKQADPLTLAAANFFDLPYLTATFPKARPLQQDAVLGGGYFNNSDSRPPGPGLVAVAPKMDIPADIAAIGLLLNAILGDPVSSASAAAGAGANDHEHLFTSGGDTVPIYTAEVEKAAGLFDVAKGVFAKTVTFNFKAGDQGYAKVSTDWGAVDVNQNQNATIAGQPTPLIGTRFPSFLGSFSMAEAAVASIMDTTWTFTNEFEEDRYLNAATLGGVTVTRRTLMIEGTARYTGDAIRAYGEVNSSGLPDPIPVDFNLSLNSLQGLLLACPAVRFEPMDTPITGIGGIEVKFKGMAEQTAGAAMATATLLNQVAAYG